MDKPTVLLVAGSAELGSSESLLLDYLLSSGEKFFNPIIIFPAEGPLTALFSQSGLETLIIPGKDYLTDFHQLWKQPLAWIYNLSSFVKMRRVIRSRRVRLVISLSFINWTGALSARQEGIPHIWMIREDLSAPKSYLKFFWGEWLASRLANDLSVKILLESSRVAKMFSRKRTRDKAEVLPPAIDADRFLGRLNESSSAILSLERNLAVFINDFDKKRNELIIKSVLQALKNDSKKEKALTKLFISFPGIEKNRIKQLGDNLEFMAAEAHLNSEIFLMDFSDFYFQPNIWKKFMAAVIIPGFDPLSRLVLEAGLAAVPLVIEDGAASELIIPEQTSLVFSSGNFQELTTKLRLLLTDENYCRLLGLAARRHLTQSHSLKDWAARWEKIIRDFIF